MVRWGRQIVVKISLRLLSICTSMLFPRFDYLTLTPFVKSNEIWVEDLAHGQHISTSYVYFLSVYLGHRLHSSSWRHVALTAVTTGAKQTPTEGHLTVQLALLQADKFNTALVRVSWQHDGRRVLTRGLASTDSSRLELHLYEGKLTPRCFC